MGHSAFNTNGWVLCIHDNNNSLHGKYKNILAPHPTINTTTTTMSSVSRTVTWKAC